MSDRPNKRRRFQKVYSSVPPEVKEIMREEAERRGLQISDVIRELLMTKYAEQAKESVKSSNT